MQKAFNAAFSKQLPTTISVSLEPGIEFDVLPESTHCAPAIEATASSLCQLFRAVQRDLEGQASGSRPRAKAHSKALDRKAPRGESGSREYHDVRKQRWVTKVRVGKRKFRALTRKVTPLQPVLPIASDACDVLEGERSWCSGEVPPLVDRQPSPPPVLTPQEEFLFG